jgi:hypothetical protein
MSPSAFALSPYPGLPFPAGVTVTGSVRRAGSKLHLDWLLEGPDGAVRLPMGAQQPTRRRDLWEETCFEFFLLSPERPGYWEFNLSPAGHWAVYHFKDYRSGMTDELAFDTLPFSVETQPGRCIVSLAVDLAVLGIAAAPWHLGISTVVADASPGLTFWALTHPGAEPDFHHPDARVEMV